MKTITLKQFVNDFNNFYKSSLGMITSINDGFEIIEDLYETDCFEMDDNKIVLYYN